MLEFDTYKVTRESKEELVKRVHDLVKTSKKPVLLCTINAHSYVEAKKDKDFSYALENADILIPDGTSIQLASRIFRLEPILKHRIPGPDFFEAFNFKANESSLTYFFLGTNDKTLGLIKKKLAKQHPNVKVHTYAPPMYPFDPEKNKNIIALINKVKPDVLWVGMTAPKQEKWANDNKTKLKVPLICPIGAAFDFYAGTRKRAPKLIQKMDIEWLFRFLMEPKRTYNRYITSNIKFIYYMVKLKLNGKKPKTLR